MDSEKIEITKDLAIATFEFVEGVLYRLGEDYDDEYPGFDCAIPLETSNYAIADCWIVNEESEVCPGYLAGGVSIDRSSLKEVIG